MRKESAKKQRQTVILAADVSGYSLTMVNLAVEIAASVQTRVQGLFIEDEDLLQVVGLPCTREITLTTARERPTDVEQMQRALQSMAEQFKQTLQEKAQAMQIAWSFDTVRGRVHEIGVKSKAEVTVTILDRSISHRLSVRQAPAIRRILLISHQSPHERQVLDVVLRRYGEERVEVTLVTTQSQAVTELDAVKPIATGDAKVSVFELSRTQFWQRLGRSGYPFDCAIVSQQEHTDDLLRILEKLQCPVILIS